MLQFLANNIEQLDLALEHVLMGDANNARFGLMLVDNIVEITLHQTAKDVQSMALSWRYHENPYEHAAALRSALGQHFGPKVKFAKLIGKLGDEESETIITLHSFRNEVYHIGVQHEPVLPAISRFQFVVACNILSKYSPVLIGYTTDRKLPKRASKYFGNNEFSFINAIDMYQTACTSLREQVPVDTIEFAAILAAHVDTVIKKQDNAVDMIATGGPKQTSRDEAVAETMAWNVAFTNEGKKFAQENGWVEGSVFDFVKWIKTHYPIPIRRDPIASWRKRANRIRLETNPHKALQKYRNFMTSTAEIRATLEEAHFQVDMYINEQIDRMRGV